MSAEEERTIISSPWGECDERLRTAMVPCERCGEVLGVSPVTLGFLARSDITCHIVCIRCAVPLVAGDPRAKLEIMPGQIEELHRNGLTEAHFRQNWEMLRRTS